MEIFDRVIYKCDKCLYEWSTFAYREYVKCPKCKTLSLTKEDYIKHEEVKKMIEEIKNSCRMYMTEIEME